MHLHNIQSGAKLSAGYTFLEYKALSTFVPRVNLSFKSSQVLIFRVCASKLKQVYAISFFISSPDYPISFQGAAVALSIINVSAKLYKKEAEQ